MKSIVYLFAILALVSAYAYENLCVRIGISNELQNNKFRDQPCHWQVKVMKNY